MNNKKLNTCINQHIVPRFLQKNFTTKDNLWRHRLDKSFVININNNFSEREYYSERPYENSSTLTLDDNITNKESHELAPHLNYLLSLSNNQEFQVNEDTSNFIFHFMFRNKSIIKSVVESLEYRFNQVFPDDILFKEKIFSMLQKKLFAEFNFNNFLCDWENLKSIIYKKHDIIRKIMFNFWFSDKQSEIRKIHENSLIDNTLLTNFKFQIVTGSFVLCDTVFIGYNPNLSTKYLPFIDNETEYIFFPISSTKCMVLYKDIMPLFNGLSINEFLVSGCNEFCCELDDKNPLIIHLKNYINKNQIINELNVDINDAIEKYEILILNTMYEYLISLCRKKPSWKIIN